MADYQLAQLNIGRIVAPLDSPQRLEHLRRHEPTSYAFTFQQRFPAPGVDTGSTAPLPDKCPAI